MRHQTQGYNFINFIKNNLRWCVIKKSSKKFFQKIDIKKWPSRRQWRKLSSLFSQKERCFILGFGILAIASLIAFFIAYQTINTKLVPDYGGKYIEGIVGSPQYINPILAQTNDVDQDVSELVFSGLMKYNAQGELEPDLAERYAIGENGKVYDFFLRKNVIWHDKEPFTADDVLFTIKTIQNPDFKSPLMFNWSGVEVKKIDNYTIRFTLSKPYAPFLNNTTIKILPKHIWQNISSPEFFLTEINLKPIGTGPYKFKKFEKDKHGSIKTIYLQANKDYHLKRPYIKTLLLKFYVNEEEAIKAYNQREVNGLSFVSPLNKLKLRGFDKKVGPRQLILPRYFAVFFNQSQSKPLSDKTVRLALNYATNKQEIIDTLLNGEGVSVKSPIPSGVFGHNSEVKSYDFDLEYAKKLLKTKDWKINEETEIREKTFTSKEGPIPLKISLITTEYPELEDVMGILQKQWSMLNIKVETSVLSIAEIQQQHIRPREYEALLFGELLSADPDPYPFWHSSQKRDPGLNLALYQNKEADKLLEEARETFDPQERKEKYEKFQELVVEDANVVFLYNSFYLYPTAKNIKGIEIKNISTPSKRFSGINEWYIETKRIKKDD